jgi:hypothetical protein
MISNLRLLSADPVFDSLERVRFKLMRCIFAIRSNDGNSADEHSENE